MEGYQLRVYGSAYASDALLVNPYAAMYGSKSREVGKLRLPLLHARELLGSLSASDVTDIISLLVSTGEFSVPRDVRVSSFFRVFHGLGLHPCFGAGS